ncbi:hypothetical protein BH23ACT3_BH23ACT3_04130 [soil metagenome]
MNDPHDPQLDASLDPELDRTLSAMLSSPAVWTEPPPDGEETLVRAIGRELRSEHPTTPTTPTTRRATWLWSAAAAVVLIAGIATVAAVMSTRDATSPGVAVALASADPAGSMTATAMVERTGGGVKIVLDPSQLPPADPGSYYHAWLTNDRDRVSAGTFHLRGGGGTIELWCGIDDPAYRTLAVTLERVENEATEQATDGGGQPVVLVGRIND